MSLCATTVRGVREGVVGTYTEHLLEGINPDDPPLKQIQSPENLVVMYMYAYIYIYMYIYIYI